VDHRDNINLGVPDAVDQPIGPLKDLSDSFPANLGHGTPRLRESTELPGPEGQAVNHTKGIVGRLFGDEPEDVVKVTLCERRPYDPHSGRPYRARISSTGVPRFCSL
jgi:hypothetical protein